MRKRENSRLGKTGFLQRIALLFLIGFFIGALFYYIFQNSFSGLMKQMTQNVTNWSAGQHSTGYELLSCLWNHGKYFALLWLLSVNNRVCRVYQTIFTMYTGLRNGFLLLFFIFGRGVKGILLYLVSLFPHCLLLLPLYLFSYLLINESRKREHKGIVCVGIVLVFFAACLLEIKCNLPIMGALL